MSTVPPGPTATSPGAETVAPTLAACACTAVVHVPAPPPASEMLSSSVRRCDERGLDLARGPGRVALDEQRRRAGDVRRGHARAVERRIRRPCELRQRRRENLAPWCGDVRLEPVLEGRRPGGRKARDDP